MSPLARGIRSRITVWHSPCNAAARDMDTRLYQLFLLNIALQLFDGVATYQGLRLQWCEGNPLLVTSMSTLGIGATLLAMTVIGLVVGYPR